MLPMVAITPEIVWGVATHLRHRVALITLPADLLSDTNQRKLLRLYLYAPRKGKLAVTKKKVYFFTYLYKSSLWDFNHNLLLRSPPLRFKYFLSVHFIYVLYE